MFQEINTNWLIYLHSLASNSELSQIFGIIADAPIFFLPIFLIIMWVYYVIKNNQKQKKELLYLFFSVVIALLINIIIKLFVDFERPDMVIDGINNLILSTIPAASFPSDHSAVSIAFITGLFFTGYKKTALIFLPFALLMNISRIISGVHWPFDVIVGMLVGVISGFILFTFLEKNKYFQKFLDYLLKIAKIFKL